MDIEIQLKRIIRQSIEEYLPNILDKYFADNKSMQHSESAAGAIMNIDQVAVLLQCSKQTCYQNINKIPHYKVNRKLLFKRSEVEKYFESGQKVKLADQVASIILDNEKI